MRMDLQPSSSRRFPRPSGIPKPAPSIHLWKLRWALKNASTADQLREGGGDGDMRTHKIAAMGGDGIGPEVVRAGVQVLKVCAERDGRFTLDFQDFDWGSDYCRTHGVMMPADGADQLRKFDA